MNDRAPTVLLVSHTHWDREWYRTFEAFRARLVDAVDRVLDLVATDPDWRFVLDGRAIVAEDYLDVRPDRRGDLEAAVRAGRIALGPWYVQPDSLLPGGEAHIRNLLEGRLVATALGGCSRVAYVPDSFGHPAQFPQLFAGFGLGPFVYWRGNGDEIDRLGPCWRWRGPDGSVVTAYHLALGYSSGAGLPDDPDDAVDALAAVLERLPAADVPAVLMNGVDHQLPDPHTAAVAEGLARRTGRTVVRALLDDLAAALPDSVTTHRPEFTGDLLGGRVANLLPGVWSSRLHLKLANRAAERAVIGWAEPWAALGAVHGLPDERPALRRARRALLANQAHDSIGGCSQDEVHRQMAGRSATAIELADQTTRRALERLAGLGPERRVPWSTELDLAVFNPTPRPRSDLVVVPLDGYPARKISPAATDVHPLVLGPGLVQGYTVDGEPARATPTSDPGRMRVWDAWPELDVAFVAHDVPAFGWKRFRLTPSGPHPDQVDDGRRIAADDVAVEAADDGTLTVTIATRTFTGLGLLEDRGDRGDTYDFDAIPDDPGAAVTACTVRRHRHPSGIQELHVARVLAVPARRDPTTDRRVAETVDLPVTLVARVAPGLDRVDLRVEIDNTACDHRLRIGFPTGKPVGDFRAATTLGVAVRSTAAPSDAGWRHPASRRFPHQGWIAANDLLVAAPGFPEAEVTESGTILVTLMRAVGWLTRFDLVSRPVPAGPAMPTPEAQCPGPLVAHLAIRLDPGDAAAALAQADELGLRAVPAAGAADADPIGIPAGTALCTVAPAAIVCSALKPAEIGPGVVVRLTNPTGIARTASVRFGFPVLAAQIVRLDETPAPDALGSVDPVADGSIKVAVPAHGTRTLLVTPAAA
ncbi:MAG: glycosyl hydrolase-related protein [Actinomycetota bacterium]